jgi:hypothetical protein
MEPAHDTEQPLNPQVIHQVFLGRDHVADRNERKIAAIGLFRCAGLIDWGPVEPLQPPMTLALMTQKRSVSKALPGPIMLSHHPTRLSCGS